MKYEARNAKCETISKFKCPNDRDVSSFEFWSLGFVSDFDVRYLDFISVRSEKWMPKV